MADEDAFPSHTDASSSRKGPQLVRVTSADGEWLEARLFRASTPRAALLWMPAMGVHARGYDRLGEALASRGVTVLIGENRGGEGSSVQVVPGADFGYAELMSDWGPMVAALQREEPTLVPHLGGHSLGGQLGLMQLAHAPAGTRLVLVASGTVHFRAWRFPHNLRVLISTQLAGSIARLMGYFPGHRLGFGGLQPRTLIDDWAQVGRGGRYQARGIDLERGLEAVTCEVLAVHVHADTLAPPSAMDTLLRKLPRARVTHVEVSAPAEPRRIDPHFRWMRAPASVAEAIAEWLPATLHSSSSS